MHRCALSKTLLIDLDPIIYFFANVLLANKNRISKGIEDIIIFLVIQILKGAQWRTSLPSLRFQLQQATGHEHWLQAIELRWKEDLWIQKKREAWQQQKCQILSLILICELNNQGKGIGLSAA